MDDATPGTPTPPSHSPRGLAALAASAGLLTERASVECFELESRSIINKTVPGRHPFDLTINPYRGCELACAYCYARYTHDFMGLGTETDFEQKIFAKTGSSEILARELKKLAADSRRGARVGPIAIGTATDPYQPSEARLEITRSILRELAKHDGLQVSLTTKSVLVLRDLDLLRELARRGSLHVNVTITTLDEGLARTLEPRAPSPRKRLEAVERIARSGLAVSVSVAPILPWITDGRLALDALLGEARSAGAHDFWAEPLFLKSCSRPSFFSWLESLRPDLVRDYRDLFARSDYLRDPGPYVSRLRRLLAELRSRHGFPGFSRVPPARPASPAPRQLSLFEGAA